MVCSNIERPRKINFISTSNVRWGILLAISSDDNFGCFVKIPKKNFLNRDRPTRIFRLGYSRVTKYQCRRVQNVSIYYQVDRVHFEYIGKCFAKVAIYVTTTDTDRKILAKISGRSPSVFALAISG